MALNPPNDDEKDKSPLNSNENEYEHGKHPNSLKNLKPFPKGVSGNVMGRPLKYENLRRVLAELGDQETFDYYDKSQGTRREQVMYTIWKKAIKGDMKFIQLLAWLGALDD